MKQFNPDSISNRQNGQRLTGFIIFVFLICLLNLIINNINHRFYVTDFKVYFYTAKNLIAGGRVYFDPDYVYKYSPFTLLLFLPYALINLKAAAVVHFFVLSFAYLITYLQIRKLLVKYFFTGIKNEGWLLSIAVICTMIFLVKELYLGNINIILIALCLLSLIDFLNGKYRRGGILFGLVILAKPFFLILILPLLFRKKFKGIAVITMTILTGLIIPFIFLGFQRSFSLTIDWFKTLMMHTTRYESMNSIDYLFHYYLFPGIKGPSEFIIIFIAGILMTWFIMKNIHLETISRETNDLQNQNFVIEWFLILALLPNIVNTDTEHFLASAPVITFIVYYLAYTKRFWLIPLMVILIFFYGGNSQDALGKDLSYRLFSMGLIGLSNLLIILMALFFYLDFRDLKSGTDSARID